MEKHIYPGYMSKEAQEFFKGCVIREEREGCATIGSFIKLASGKTHLPSKGEEFEKDEEGRITVKSIYG
jgi:hypothetical protein